MTALAQTLGRLRRLGAALCDDMSNVDEALPAVRALLTDAAVSYRIVGGLAVIHHGYARLTEDIDILIAATGIARLKPLLSKHGFEATDAKRLRHVSTGVRVDLLVGGSAMPRPGAPHYPMPEDVLVSPRSGDVASLAALVALKLHARRHQDEADVVALLKLLDEHAYHRLEATTPSPLRAQLWQLRRDALEELSWAAAEQT